MNTSKRRSILLLLILMLLALSVVAYNAATKQSQEKAVAQKLKARPRAKNKPTTTSAIAGLEIVSAELENDSLQVIIKNNTNKGVTAFRLSGSEFSTGFDGGVTDDPPSVVIPPHETTQISFAVNNLYEGEPLVLSAVRFEDGSEIGTKKMLDIMRHDRKVQREEYLKRKEGTKQ
jgi:hypothetical protein